MTIVGVPSFYRAAKKLWREVFLFVNLPTSHILRCDYCARRNIDAEIVCRTTLVYTLRLIDCSEGTVAQSRGTFARLPLSCTDATAAGL